MRTQTEYKDQIREQHSRGYDNYTIETLDLNEPRTDEIHYLTGSSIIVVEVSSAFIELQVKIDDIATEPLVLRVGKKITTPFSRLYFTNAQQPGDWMKLAIGRVFDSVDQILEGQAQPCREVVCAVAGTNYAGPAQPCNVAMIQAPASNTGIIYVNFGISAATGAAFCLYAGGVVCVPVRNLNKLNFRAAVAGEKITIVYAL
jgi:hypothetical protein